MEPTKTVNLHIDPRVHRMIAIEAIRTETTIQSIINEALTAWTKWLRTAERAEQKEAELAQTEAELKAATELLDEIIRERTIVKRKRGRHKPNQRRAKFPGMDWTRIDEDKKQGMG